MDRIIGFDAQMLAQIALHIISILVLFFALAKLLFNPVREILRKRKEGITSELNNIKNEKEEVQSLKETYESKLANIEQEADEILSVAHKRAKKKEKQIILEANEEAERILSRTKLELEREKQKARDDLKKEVVAVASLMASKFVMSSIDADTQNKLVDETINEMGDHTWQD